MPQSRTTILSTRPLDEALVSEARLAGVDIDALSFIDTAPVSDPFIAGEIRRLAFEPLVAVFTSMNAVEAVVAAADASWRVYCIGAATKDLVVRHFGVEQIAGTAPSASELADVVLKDGVREVYFFCGDQRRDELPEKLRGAGVVVNELVVYTTRQTPHSIGKAYDGIAFFSPSAVHSFFLCNKAPEAAVLFAIGRTTADTIRQYSNNPIITSGAPEKDALIRLAVGHFRTDLNT